MKLSFSIQYGTQWGENLHVVIRYMSADGTRKQYNLLMTTDDGTQWTTKYKANATSNKCLFIHNLQFCYKYTIFVKI